MSAYRKNKKLLEMARSVFGDIVEDAFIVVPWYEEVESDKYSLEILNDYELSSQNKDVLDLEQEIILTFRDANTVKFSVSEWGDVSKIDLKDRDKFVLK